MFTKILIANRGEIACRVVKTARRMGIGTVAVYSEADRQALHVALADEAVCIGPAPSRESYLVADKIVAACKETGAQAVHPGYGFLSENEAFARRLEDEGIVFIGPKHAAIASMGDKIASKRLAAAARVNTIPGHDGAIESADLAVEIARTVGYPVMIKASAGGGGKGLRVAWNDEQAREGFASCRSEAGASFGDDRVLIEKFIQEPRHIEIQVLGDAHGNLVYLWERECSLQRRHQKVVEEAPSVFVDEALRKSMGEQAVALARAVDYQSAGTVEFVVGKDKRFFFLEMNTRLQVEHPVTEAITGLDLVEQMIRVAAGEKLAFTQEQIVRRGWAIECRINAEDPARGFLPSIGRLVTFRPPEQNVFAGEPPEAGKAHGIRVDTGVREGGEISVYYDSMICKLITSAADRATAIATMRQALDAFVIRGVSSNVAFQAALLAHPRFAAGDFDTGFIGEVYPNGFDPASSAGSSDAAPAAKDGPPATDIAFMRALAAAVHLRVSARSAPVPAASAIRTPGTGRTPVLPLVVVEIGAAGERSETEVAAQVEAAAVALDAFAITIGAKTHRIEFSSPLRDIAVMGSLDGKAFAAQVDRVGLGYRLTHGGRQIEARVLTPRQAELDALMPFKPPPDRSGQLLSPMPGLLVDIAVKEGQAVRAGERLAVIEAMKMENILVAAHHGVIAKVVAERGESLAVDDVILEFETAGAKA